MQLRSRTFQFRHGTLGLRRLWVLDRAIWQAYAEASLKENGYAMRTTPQAPQGD